MDPGGNPQLKLAFEFVQNTGKNIFLTGKAGTGKTTFLHSLKDNIHKRIIVVAPTGVAAINAGGVTIHSFFQLPFGPIIPGGHHSNTKTESKIQRFSKQKINIIRSIDLLIIDEVSMVRADLLDGIDSTLRRFRNRNAPFGGVQLLMIGDLQQLAPVVKNDEWKLLENHYSTPFFFGSQALKKTNYISIELQHVYRQTDIDFINLLNAVRNNEITPEIINTLNQRYNPNYASLNPGYIILTTHNSKAALINNEKLDKISDKSFRFSATIEGSFPEFAYPNDAELILKKGSQVMFIKNDPSPDKLFFNGKIGTISDISHESIVVSCDGDNEDITVERLQWDKIKYSINAKTSEIEEKIEGTYTQFPLKLAWAITIHKSQGLTFENAVIDAQDAFAHGQVYVALSRCKTLDGIILSSKIAPSLVTTNSTIDRFNKEVEANQPNEEILETEKKQYQLDLLLDLFDFNKLNNLFGYCIRQLEENIKVTSQKSLNALLDADKINTELGAVANKFRTQLKQLATEEKNIEQNTILQERIKKASDYFLKSLTTNAQPIVNDFTFETDNKDTKRTLNNAIQNIENELKIKVGCLNNCTSGFSITSFLKAKAIASITDDKKVKRKPKVTSLAMTDDNPELYRILKAWRDAKAKELDWQLYRVIQLKTMRQICTHLPTNPNQLKQIIGMGEVKMKLFSDELLDIVNDYCGEYGIKKSVNENENIEIIEKINKPKKFSTSEISYNLFKEGYNIAEIASKRALKISTIEKHFEPYVKEGEIAINELIKPEKVKLITLAFVNNKSSKLPDIKEMLGRDYTYSDIRFTYYYLKHKKIID